MITSMPVGWRMRQFKPEQPATTYEMFRNAILMEIARCVNMPYNVAAGNSSKFNYASGRLDWQTYHSAIDVERSEWDVECLDRILEHWWDEAVLDGLIPRGLPPMDFIPHQWMWPGREHVDPSKDANGQHRRLASGTTHRAKEYAKNGLDVDVEDEKAAESFGMTVREYRRALAKSLFQMGDGTDDAETDEDDDVDETADEVETAAA
jgi:capsid protein